MFFACAFQSADEFICASLFVPLGIMNTAPTLKNAMGILWYSADVKIRM